MTPEGLQPTEVVALRFDAEAVAEELAAWCGGEVSHPVDEPGVVVLLVPGPEGARPAHVGDWLVAEPDGTHRVMSAEAFAARYEPAG